jgi:hypothetical protein
LGMVRLGLGHLQPMMLLQRSKMRSRRRNARESCRNDDFCERTSELRTRRSIDTGCTPGYEMHWAVAVLRGGGLSTPGSRVSSLETGHAS